MRPLRELSLLALVAGLAACSNGTTVEIANNDARGLVEAIRLANERPGHTTIRLARRGFYVLGQEVREGLLLPPVTDRLTLEGNYAEIRGYSARPASLLQVEDGARVELEDLVLAEGTDGAVRNFGELVMRNVAIVDSSVRQAPYIVLNHGRLVARDSEIAYNLLFAGRRDSGTVLNYGDLELDATRVHGNRAVGSDARVAAAGGILNFGTLRADGLAIEDNEAPGEALPRLHFGGVLNLGNGRVEGLASADSVRDGREAAMLAGR